MAFTLSDAARNAMCNALVNLMDGGAGAGYFTICDSSDTVLATLLMSNPAFGDAIAGVAKASAITDDSAADATGTAAKCYFYDGDDMQIFEGTVSGVGGGGNIELFSTSIILGQQVSVALLTVAMPAS